MADGTDKTRLAKLRALRRTATRKTIQQKVLEAGINGEALATILAGKASTQECNQWLKGLGPRYPGRTSRADIEQAILDAPDEIVRLRRTATRKTIQKVGWALP